MLKNLRPARHGVLEVSPARVKKPCTASADRLTSNQPIKSIRGVGFYGGGCVSVWAAVWRSAGSTCHRYRAQAFPVTTNG